MYSLHKLFTAYIAKGKAATPYKFNNKVGMITYPTRKIVLTIKTFRGNPHDSKTIQPLIKQISQTGRYLPEEIIYDWGGRGQKPIEGITITTLNKPKISDFQNKKRPRRRAGIEAIIIHLKSDHRMIQNYPHGAISPDMNARPGGI